MKKEKLNEKLNNEGEKREVCCLCFCTMGVSQRDKRKLPNGQFAEESCINKVIFRELIRPIKKFAPNLNHPPLSTSAPEAILEGLALSLLTQPALPWVQDLLSKVLSFSQSFLGKEIILSNLLSIVKKL